MLCIFSIFVRHCFCARNVSWHHPKTTTTLNQQSISFSDGLNYRQVCSTSQGGETPTTPVRRAANRFINQPCAYVKNYNLIQARNFALIKIPFVKLHIFPKKVIPCMIKNIVIWIYTPNPLPVYLKDICNFKQSFIQKRYTLRYIFF